MRSTLVALFPLALVAALFLGVVHARPTPSFRRTIPQESFRTDRCTWYCHNHGCRHKTSLPDWLTSDAGAFGFTIRGLYALGRVVSNDAPTGYGIANLLVFCTAWPVLTYGLWITALLQHKSLKRERARQRHAEVA